RSAPTCPLGSADCCLDIATVSRVSRSQSAEAKALSRPGRHAHLSKGAAVSTFCQTTATGYKQRPRTLPSWRQQEWISDTAGSRAGELLSEPAPESAAAER